MEDVRAHLAGQSKDALVELLMSRAATDERLRDRLLLETAGRRSSGVDLATFRAAIDRAVIPDDYEDYRPAFTYANDIEQVIDRIQVLLDDGHAEAVVELAEHAIEAVEQALGWIDDSDGYLGGVLERLGDLHHAACAQAQPDPEELAERLFRRELRSDWETSSVPRQPTPTCWVPRVWPRTAGWPRPSGPVWRPCDPGGQAAVEDRLAVAAPEQQQVHVGLVDAAKAGLPRSGGLGGVVLKPLALVTNCPDQGRQVVTLLLKATAD